jgi:uncharacterized protein (DUF488 family)
MRPLAPTLSPNPGDKGGAPSEFQEPALSPKEGGRTGHPAHREWRRDLVATIYTIGHSTRTLDELVAALKGHEITTLVDIRSFPMSRRLPHFNRERLEQELPKHSIAYVWLKELGGRRKRLCDDSPNTALRNESFRNYADYMMTDEFASAIDRLLEIADREKTAIMCAERVYFQCHRMLVSDYLVAHGHTVLHIDDEKRPMRPHKLMAEARLLEGKLVYDAQRLF